MKKAWNLFAYLFIIVGVFGFYWAGYSLCSKMIFFWQHGVEKQVKVKSLEHTTIDPRTGRTYQYLFEIDGIESRQYFRTPLPAGENISVLVSPENSEEIILGSKEDNIFELFSFI